ncbi:MAG: response regulator transcription factor [Deltaproteobacteria bacterium]|nr:MAG: response regulator transcription factor [Deltaproteobacteria bacterium]
MNEELTNQLIYLLGHQKRSLENLEAERIKFKSNAEVSFLIERIKQDGEVILQELTSLIESTKNNQNNDSPLSPREAEILQLLSDGFANKEIAYQLSISERTVQFHIKSLFEKLKASSRTDVVIKAIKKGWLNI